MKEEVTQWWEGPKNNWSFVAERLQTNWQRELWRGIIKGYSTFITQETTFEDWDMEWGDSRYMGRGPLNSENNTVPDLEPHELGKYEFYYVCYGDPQISCFVYENPGDNRATIIPMMERLESLVEELAKELGLIPDNIRLAAMRRCYDSSLNLFD